MADVVDDLKSQRDRFLAFSFAAADLLLEVDDEGKIVFASGAGTGVTSTPARDLVGLPLKSLVAEQDHDFLNAIFSKVKPGVRMDPVPILIKSKKDRFRRTLISGFALPGCQSGRVFLTLSLADRMPSTSINMQPRSKVAGMLTPEAFLEAARYQTKINIETDDEDALSLMVLNGLEEMAKSHGQEVVDRFMQKLSSHLRASSLLGDSVGLLADGKVGVLHGHDITGEDLKLQARIVAKEFYSETGVEIDVENFSVDLSVPGMSDEDASRAVMYAVKKFSDMTGGEFKVASLQDGARDLLKNTLQRVAQLRQTIAESAFDIVYQPIIDLELRTVHHYEALTRFESNKSPAKTIAFAEEVGLIEDFDLLLMQRVLEVLTEQNDMGNSPSVAINLSAKSLNSDVWVRSLGQVIQPFSHVRKQLSFEITETAQINDFQRFNNVSQVLRKAGHMVGLDDVGHGSTSFQSLDLLKVDMVKIDGVYIQNAAQGTRRLAMLKSIIALCKDLDVKMVAEMIDTESQVKNLRSLGVQFGQGYLFARPNPLFLASDDLLGRNK